MVTDKKQEIPTFPWNSSDEISIFLYVYSIVLYSYANNVLLKCIIIDKQNIMIIIMFEKSYYI